MMHLLIGLFPPREKIVYEEEKPKCEEVPLILRTEQTQQHR